MRETRRATSRGLSLLGGWQLVVDGDVVALGGREQRLCALLALTGPRARAQVAGTLWPESTDARALASLRRAVAQTHQRCPGLLAADRTSVGLATDVVVDVDVLRAAVSAVSAAAGAETGSEAGSDAGSDGALLVTLAGDQLLPGWYDGWVEEHRDDPSTSGSAPSNDWPVGPSNAATPRSPRTPRARWPTPSRCGSRPASC
jgi:DNA-binding SARP family transcriptional activator